MDYKELKALVEYYEDRIDKNFDFYFNQLVLMDFYEGGYEINANDIYYYQEFFNDFNEVIKYLLIETENELSDEFYNLKLRLIHLKRIIDNKISLVPKDFLDDELDESENVYLPNLKTNTNPFSISREDSFIIGPNISKEKFIKTLHKSLIGYGFITDSLEKFNSIFKNTFYPTNKIKWNGTEAEITFLISQLISEGYFEKDVEKRWLKLICDFFLNKNGKEFKAKQLSTSFNEKKELLKPSNSIFKVIKEMSTHS